jgi:putative transposase
LDGYKPSIGFVQVNLRPPQSMKIVYEHKKAIAQRKGRRELYEKYKARRKRNHRTPWRSIRRRISGVALTASVDPSNTSRECPRCGYVVKTQEGQILKCPRCSLRMNRHKVASINIRRRYLENKKRKGKERKTRMQRFLHSNEPEA